MSYSCLPYYSSLYDGKKQRLSFPGKSQEDYYSWKSFAQEELKQLIGLPRCHPVTRIPSLLWEKPHAAGSLEHWTLVTEEFGQASITCTFFIQRPQSFHGMVVLRPHGHDMAGEEVANDPFSLQLVKNGYLVLCPDARGSGLRKECEDVILSHEHLLHMGLGFGISPIAMNVLDLQCLLTALPHLLPGSPYEVITAGFSGGAQQALWLSALDARPKMILLSGYFYGMKDSLLDMPENCACNYLPDLWNALDCGDLGALLCPRPLLISSGRKDPLNGARGLKNVEEPFQTTRSAYALFGKEPMIHWEVHEKGHEFCYEHWLSWIEKNRR